MTENVIELKNLCKVFHTEDVETTALNDVSMAFGKGEFVAIMGPSGCGKSTLLSILGLMDGPSSGDLFFLGENVSKASESKMALLRKANLGFIFQAFNLIDELSVSENVELPLIYQGVPPAERKKRVKAVLDKVEMSHRMTHMPQQLSGGQQQRVSVARAVVTEPKLILADEPTGNLDSKTGEEVMKILVKLNEEGSTIIMVTHQQEFADWAGRTVRFLDGSLQSEVINSGRPG